MDSNVQPRLTIEPMTWNRIPNSKFSIMTNSAGELFVEYEGKKIRLTPDWGGFKITEFASTKLAIPSSGIYVR